MDYQFVKNKLRYLKRFLLGAPERIDTESEPVELKFMLSFLEKRDLAYDVGSNIGVWSYFLALSPLNLKVVCFEPNPKVAKSLLQNVSEIKNITVEKCGVGDVNGSSDFHVHPSHGRSSFGYTSEYSGCKVLSVPIITLDRFSLELGEKSLPALIKVDVEGFEPEVWDGMQRLLNENRPKVMVFELEDRHLKPRGHSVKGMASKIVNSGYSCFVYDDEKMISVDVDEFEFPPETPKPRKYTNFVFVDSKLINAG